MTSDAIILASEVVLIKTKEPSLCSAFVILLNKKIKETPDDNTPGVSSTLRLDSLGGDSIHGQHIVVGNHITIFGSNHDGKGQSIAIIGSSGHSQRIDSVLSASRDSDLQSNLSTLSNSGDRPSGLVSTSLKGSLYSIDQYVNASNSISARNGLADKDNLSDLVVSDDSNVIGLINFQGRNGEFFVSVDNVALVSELKE